jgi:hypothetical protein
VTLWPAYEVTQVNTKSLFVPVRQHIIRNYTNNTGFTLKLDVQFFVNFTAKGSLSVNNPISVSATVVSNDTNFMDDYHCLGFTNAYNASNEVQFSCLLFNSLGNDEYSAEGSLVWLVEGPSWVVIAPKGNILLTKEQTNLGDPTVYISGVSDTLSITSSENNERLTWVLVAFSFLSLQFLIEALVVRDNPEKIAPAQVKSEGFWASVKRWRKSRLKEQEARTLGHTKPTQ